MLRGVRCLRPLWVWASREAGRCVGLRRRPCGASRAGPLPLGSRRLGGFLGSSEQAAVAAEDARGRPERGPSRFNFEDIVSLLRQENAKDICAIQLPPEMKYSNYFIIVSGTSSRHLHAMAHYLIKMYKHLKTDCDPHVLIEGKDTDDWLCIDFGHTVVHFMLPETREVYELEKLWTLRSYDDQLAQMIPESLPDNFIFGMPSEQEELATS
ncbi:mitochondrial assembly of ribosomal large subunit protein 1 [Sceloporus undulatus]|uniref:mitochondrial assembly of ribosomal large subunit protein 1 n=1 Tax=Sceloporus undulatus TaxID=8520 RepID=UPI001C4D51ED|nr:mitochondrial assembly of ribosomal large subunit protein 1 [Sceloporus undulatus]